MSAPRGHPDTWDAPAPTLDGDPSSDATSDISDLSLPPAPPHVDTQGDHLGRGAHGAVFAAPDRRLPRSLAWKTVPAGDLAGEQRLRHEADILAALEHPGVVPVHDLTRGANGSLRLGLRRIHGQTLGELIREAPDEAARLRLLRHVLSAAEALALAHDLGIVHRDVKSSNIMVGRYGETFVLDWGVALRLDAPPPPGAVVGTPYAMSPEQARGELVTPASDVWALGVLLVELLTGRPPAGETATDALLEARRTGRGPVAVEAAPGAPPELLAIATRALRPEPEARYADAAAFAEDLTAFMDGRVVGAHDYTPRELFARFVRRFRWQLTAAALTLTVAGIAAGLSWTAVTAERDRAVEARREATAALVEAGLANAVSAHALGARPEAELAAALVLRHTESPRARGILASFASQPPPRRMVAAPLMSPLPTHPAVRLERWVARPGVKKVVLKHDDGRLVQHRDACGGELAAAGRSLVAYHAACLAFMPDVAATPPEVYRVSPCGAAGAIQSAAPIGPDGWIALCHDGTLVSGGRQVQSSRATALASPVRAFRAMAVDTRTGALVIGTTRSQILRVTDGEVAVSRHLRAARSVLRLTLSPGGDLVLVELDGTGARLVDARSLETRLSLPTSLAALGFGPASELVAATGRSPRPNVAWELPAGSPPTLEGYSGVISLAPFGTSHLVVTHTDRLSVIDLRSGIPVAHAAWSDVPSAVVKGAVVSPAPTPRGLAALTTTLHGARIDDGDGDGAFIGLGSYRRLAPFAHDRALGLLSRMGLDILDRDGHPISHLALPRLDDIAVAGARAVVADAHGTVHLLDVSGPPQVSAACEAMAFGGVALVERPDGLIAFGLQPDGLIAFDPERCHILGVYPTGTETPRSLAASAADDSDGQEAPSLGLWVAAGTRRGEVLVWDGAGTLRAEVRNHDEPVTALAFSPNGHTLFSGAWDGRIQRMDLATLLSPRTHLASAVDGAWEGSR